MHFGVEPFFYLMVNFVREGYEDHMGIVVIGYIEIETLRYKRVQEIGGADTKAVRHLESWLLRKEISMVGVEQPSVLCE
jgi:hypothetical protein